MTDTARTARPSRMACLGAETKSVHEFGGSHMEECRECGSRVQWQLVHHPIWGFRASCERRAAGVAVLRKSA